MSETKRDINWKRIPVEVQGYAALNVDGNIMPNSVRARPQDVRLSAGECIPVKVIIQYLPDEPFPETVSKARRRSNRNAVEEGLWSAAEAFGRPLSKSEIKIAEIAAEAALSMQMEWNDE